MLAIYPKVHPTLPVDHENSECPGPGWVRVPMGALLKPGDVFYLGRFWKRTGDPGRSANFLNYFRAGTANPGYALHEDEGG